jgi:hypothetical protein
VACNRAPMKKFVCLAGHCCAPAVWIQGWRHDARGLGLLRCLTYVVLLPLLVAPGPGTEPSSSWCADLPQLSLLASPATPQTSQQVRHTANTSPAFSLATVWANFSVCRWFACDATWRIHHGC